MFLVRDQDLTKALYLFNVLDKNRPAISMVPCSMFAN